MKLNIFGETWTIKFMDKVVDEEGEEIAGACIPSKRLIEIGPATGKNHNARVQDASRIIYHEFIHAVFAEADYRDLDWFTKDIEHAIIAPLAKALAKNFPFRS